MVVVPATPREVSTRKLNTVRVANTVLRRAIGDLQADEGAEGGRRQAKVGGDDFYQQIRQRRKPPPRV